MSQELMIPSDSSILIAQDYYDKAIKNIPHHSRCELCWINRWFCFRGRTKKTTIKVCKDCFEKNYSYSPIRNY